MSALELLVVASVLTGISVQSAIGFGFAFFVAPASFAAFAPAEAVTLVLLLAIAINSLVLFAEGRTTRVARRPTIVLVAAGLPGMALGAWVITEVSRPALQLLVGLVVLAGALVQWRGARPGRARPERAPAIEVGGGFAAGALTTSVGVNGPALLLAFSHLGLRGAALRDSLAAALLGLSVPATVIVLVVADGSAALPNGAVALACVPALLVGHRLGAVVFSRLDDATHHRATLAAACVAGLLSVAAAVG